MQINTYDSFLDAHDHATHAETFKTVHAPGSSDTTFSFVLDDGRWMSIHMDTEMAMKMCNLMVISDVVDG